MIRMVQLNFPVIEADWLNYQRICKGHGIDPHMFIMSGVIAQVEEVGECGLLDDPFARHAIRETVQSLKEIMDCEYGEQECDAFSCSAKPGGGQADERGLAARRRGRRRRR